MGVDVVRAPEVSKRIDVNFARDEGKTSIVVDGIDITYWIAADPVIIETTKDGFTTLTVKLTAPNVRVVIVP